MCLHPHDVPSIPDETARVAHAAFRKGTLFMRMRDEIGTIYRDEAFAALFPARGKPAEAPWRLALVTVQEAAHRVGIGNRTANRWIAAGRFPERKIRQRTASMIDTYTDYLQPRWDEGCRNRTQIWREICEQGYEGSYPSVYQYLVRVQAGAVTPAGATLAPGAARRRLSPRQAVWLLLRPEDTLDADDCTLLAELQHVCKDAAAAHPLAQDFLALLRERKHDEFDHWVTAAQESGLPELERFALGLRRDTAAVRAALSVEHSNGQTEGQVNRLKVIKRAMYGRGNFDLLRQRVLHAG